jgi:hypothetical protein
MKKAILLATTLLAATSASAQSGGYYEFIPYYGNDPFVFCTVGVPWDCWAPISPQLGTFTVTNPYCFNPTSAAQYARVCPRAFPTGGAGVSAGQASAMRVPAGDPANASP